MMAIFAVCFLCSLLAIASALDLESVYTKEELRNIDDSVAEDARLNFTKLATKYGYPVELHTAVTEDGHYLTLHRIPFGRVCGPGKSKVPVLVLHGLFCSSDDFIITGPSKGLGYILADACYDVWLGNNRGNKYSRQHKSLNVKNENFWKFSWHEMGFYDLPAMVDYILRVTGHPALHYVGHSQGTTQFFIFSSLRTEYHNKLRSAHMLSPVAFMNNLDNITLKILSIFHKPLQLLSGLVGMHEFLPSCKFLNMVGMELCKDKYPAFQAICKSVMFLLSGSSAELLNSTMLPAIIGHTPAGGSTRQLIHYAQGILSDGFRQYDHGAIMNVLKYGSLTPPSYPVNKVNVPVAFYFGINDMLANINDIRRLGKLLPNLIAKITVANSKFGHLDYLWSTEAKTLVYDEMMNIMKRF